MKTFFMAALAAVSFAAFGEVHTFNKTADWRPAKTLTQKGDKLNVKGHLLMVSKKIFDIDAKKKYKLTMTARNSGKVKTPLFFGFSLVSKDGKRQINAQHINAVPKSQTTVVRAVKKGDTVVYLGKEAANWRKVGHSFIAPNAKADFSDLPNFNVCHFPVKSIEKCPEGVKVTLTKGFGMALAKGAVIRQHLSDGYMYAGGIKTLQPGKSAKFQGSVVSTLPGPGYSHRTWSKYAGKARVIVLANWGSKVAEAELSGISLEITDKK